MRQCVKSFARSARVLLGLGYVWSAQGVVGVVPDYQRARHEEGQQ